MTTRTIELADPLPPAVAQPMSRMLFSPEYGIERGDIICFQQDDAEPVHRLAAAVYGPLPPPVEGQFMVLMVPLDFSPMRQIEVIDADSDVFPAPIMVWISREKEFEVGEVIELQNNDRKFEVLRTFTSLSILELPEDVKMAVLA